MKKTYGFLLAAAVTAAFTQAQAQTIADWTFETSVPANGGPFSPETGAGSATGSHASGSAVFSSPAGNGSSHSFSANVWSVGDFYQVQVSTLGLHDVTLTFDQVSSATGPGTFKLQYSTDGSSFTTFGSDYNLLVNAAPNAWSTTPANHVTTTTFTFDLSSIGALDNQATVFLRFADDSTQSASQVNGGTLTLATGGTDRMDNIVVDATVPEPTTLALLAMGGAAGLAFARRRK